MATLLLNERPPSGVLLAQAVGLTASSFLFAYNSSMSIYSIPTIKLAPPQLAAQQFCEMYEIGHKVGPALACISSGALGYVAYQQDPSSLAYKLNVTAVILLPSIIPYTFAAIMETNKTIFDKADDFASTPLEDKSVETGVPQHQTINALIEKWRILNLSRAAIIAVACVCANWAVFDRWGPAAPNDFGFATGSHTLN